MFSLRQHVSPFHAGSAHNLPKLGPEPACSEDLALTAWVASSYRWMLLSWPWNGDHVPFWILEISRMDSNLSYQQMKPWINEDQNSRSKEGHFFKTTEHPAQAILPRFWRHDSFSFIIYFHFLKKARLETCDFFVEGEKACVWVFPYILPITKKKPQEGLRNGTFPILNDSKTILYITAMAMTPAVTTLALAGPNAKNPGDWPCQFCKKVQFARDSPFEPL